MDLDSWYGLTLDLFDRRTRRARRGGGGGGGGGGGPAPAPADYIITNATEWANTMALGAATLAGKIAEVRGALGAVSISNLSPASAFTIRGGAGGSIRRLTLTGPTNRLTFSGLPFQMTGWPFTENSMVFFDNGSHDNIRFQGCSFRHGYGPSLVNFDQAATYPEYARVDNVTTASATSSRIALNYSDSAVTIPRDAWIEFFNRGAVGVRYAIGNSTVTATLSDPLVAPGARARITWNVNTTDRPTHIAVITASGTSEVNARTEIGLSSYLCETFTSSGSATMGRLDIIGCTFRDVNNGAKGLPRCNLAVVMDNDFDRIYQDVIAVVPTAGGSAYLFRNLMTVPFSRSGIAENLNGDARDPHGDFFQCFTAAPTGTIGPIYVGGNRPRRSARRVDVAHQGIFFSDNDNNPSYNGIYVVSDMLIGGLVNGITSGEASFPTGDFLVDGAIVLDANNLTGGTSAVRLNTVAEGRAHIARTVMQSIVKEGAGFVVDNSLLMSTAASIPALFPNSANVPTAVTRAEIETAWTTAAEAAGLGAVATANAIDWTTTNHENVILWANVVSGVGWEDLTGQSIGSTITLPLRKVLNRRANQTITPGAGIEWRSTQSDGTTEVQAWTTSSGTVQPDQFVQIRGTSSASPLTSVNFDVTINGFLARTSIRTTAATPAVFHTQSGTGPYFRDPSNLTPADTTRMEWRANIRPTGNPAGTVRLFAQESTGCDVYFLSNGNIQVVVEDGTPGAGVAVVNAQNASVNLLANQWQEYTLDADHTAGTAVLRRDGAVIGSWTWTPTAFPFFQTGREISFFGTSAGVNLMPSGWQVEFGECFFTTSGVRSLRKRIDGNAATVNADAWRLGDPAT